MTPERVAGLVGRWVRFYTRNLPPPIAERRIGEIDADLHDHVAHERAHGSGDSRIAVGIVSRMVRGLASDASWRGHHAVKRATAHRAVVHVVLATAFILSLPLMAMQFTDSVTWGPFDFVVAGALLMGTGLVLVAASRLSGGAYRVAAAVALGAVLVLVWSALAVGILGGTGDPADLMYAGVLAVGIVGAVIARFRPRGMARALLAMAVAQALVAAVALLAGTHQAPTSSVAEVVGLNAFFFALFAGSAGLFRRAARDRPLHPE